MEYRDDPLTDEPSETIDGGRNNGRGHAVHNESRRHAAHPAYRETSAADTLTSATTTSPWDFLTPVVLCILATETGERFAYFGFRAVLVLYFTMELGCSDSQAAAWFAYTTSLAYMSPVLGAIVADGVLGRYHTILWFGVVYVLGLAILTASALYAPVTLERAYTALGLLLVCIGTGGIKPCVSAFGADQVAMKKGTDHCHSLIGGDGGGISPNCNSSRVRRNGSYQDMHHDVPNVYDPREAAAIGMEDGMEGNSSNDNENVRIFFSYFYFCINVGALLSIFLVPIVRGKYGFGAAFLLPACFMTCSMLLFVGQRHAYVRNVPGQDGTSLTHTFRLCAWLARQNLVALVPWIARHLPWVRPGPMPTMADPRGRRNRRHRLVPNRDVDADDCKDHGSDASDDDDDDDDGDYRRQMSVRDDEQLNDAAQALHVLPILATLPVFWSLYDQQSSVWTLQAARMHLNGLQPEQMNVINPVQIMLFIPLFDRVIYPAMLARGWNIAPLRRMSWGMLLTAVAFFLSGLVEAAIQHAAANGQEKVNVFWQVPQITVLAVGEIFLSVTGLEFAYATSPVRLKAFVMSMYLLTTAVGDFFSGILYSTVFAKMSLVAVMHVFGILMLGNYAFFKVVAAWWEGFEANDLKRTASLEGLELDQVRRIV